MVVEERLREARAALSERASADPTADGAVQERRLSGPPDPPGPGLGDAPAAASAAPGRGLARSGAGRGGAVAGRAMGWSPALYPRV